MSLVDKDTNLTFIKRLGEGGFGYVDLVRDDEGGLYARKRMMVKSERKAKNVINDMAPLKHLSAEPNCHSLVLCYYNSWIVETWIVEDKYNYDVILITDYIKGYNLKEYIEALGDDPISANTVNSFARLMLEALDYMHKNGIAHRDIKPANIMFNKREIKLIDFDFACFIPEKRVKPVCKSRLRGTPRFIAPEILKKGKYFMPADIWALGIILYYMVKREYPFVAESVEELLDAIRYNPVPKIEFDEEYREIEDIVKASLVKDSKKRATAEELLELLD